MGKILLGLAIISIIPIGTVCHIIYNVYTFNLEGATGWFVAAMLQYVIYEEVLKK